MDEYGNLNTASLGTEYLMTNAWVNIFIIVGLHTVSVNFSQEFCKTLEWGNKVVEVGDAMLPKPTYRDSGL